MTERADSCNRMNFAENNYKPMKIAVITGDVVNSTQMQAGARKLFFDALLRCFQELETLYNIRIELFRGDSFQCVVSNIQDSLQLALEIMTFIRSLPPEPSDVFPGGDERKKTVSPLRYNVRISIGIGEVDFVHDSTLTSDGSAFRLSGRQLDEMKNKKQFLTIAADDDHHRELQMESVLLDVIMSNNTLQQNEVINKKLRGHIETEIAMMLSIKQPAVNQRLRAGGWHAIDAMLKHFKSLYNNG